MSAIARCVRTQAQRIVSKASCAHRNFGTVASGPGGIWTRYRCADCSHEWVVYK